MQRDLYCKLAEFPVCLFAGCSLHHTVRYPWRACGVAIWDQSLIGSFHALRIQANQTACQIYDLHLWLLKIVYVVTQDRRRSIISNMLASSMSGLVPGVLRMACTQAAAAQAVAARRAFAADAGASYEGAVE